MKGDKIKYRDGYKYQLVCDYSVSIPIRPKEDIEIEFITLSRDGLLLIKHGYAWDGPSGPTIDTRTSMRGSLVHDVLYQLIRDGYLNQLHREDADIILRDILIEDGMPELRAEIWYKAVRLFGERNARLGTSSGKNLHVAP